MTRMLEVESDFSEEYLLGHAKRIGLAGGERTPQDAIDRLLPAIRRDVRFESDRIRDAGGFEEYYRMREADGPDENARPPLAKFLSIPPEERAREIAATDYLFAD